MPNAFEFGTVYAFVSGEKKNFGWILPDAGLPRIFFHISNFVGPDAERVPQKGDRVIFTRGKTGTKGPRVKEVQFDPFVSYGDICHERLGTTTQYGVYYIGGLLEIPDLSDGIRIDGTRAMYHSLRIHRNDVETLVARIKKWERLRLEHRRPVLIYTNEIDAVFFSSQVMKDDAPAGFTPVTFDLPIKIKPWGRFIDGIVGTPADLVESQFSGLKHIPNPDPSMEPEYSGYYKKTE